jgi:lipopolysaccharide transport system permease protein
MLWNFFSTCLNSASGIFLDNSSIFGKVYFPRLSMPISTTMSAVFRLLVQFVVLMFFLAYYIMIGNPVRPTLWALLFPLIVIWIGFLGTGLGMICSSLTTKYRDLNHAVVLALQLAMYVTPIVYPLSQVPEGFRRLFYINPLSAPVELFRIWFYGAGSVTNEMISISVVSTALIVFIGLVLFHKTERTFMDVI